MLAATGKTFSLDGWKSKHYDNQRYMRILIIGGTRFIGPPLVARLAGAGHEVTVLHRGETEADLPPSVAHIHADRHSLDTVAKDLTRLRPDVAVDMAAYNEQDAREVIEALRGVAGRLVTLSSQDVYRAYGRLHRTEPAGGDGAAAPAGPGGPAAEDAPLRERLYPYRGTGRGLDDYEKILVERAVMAEPSLPATVLRLPMVYGEGDYQRRVAIELQRMDDGRPAVLLEQPFASWRWTRGYAGNIAAAIALTATNDGATGKTYNLGDAEPRSYAEWVSALGAAAGWNGRVLLVDQGSLPPQLRPPDGDYTQHLVADTSRIRNELGFVDPVPFFQGLRRAIEWERTQRETHPLPPIDYAAEDAILARVPADELPPRPAAEAAPPNAEAPPGSAPENPSSP
jgi:nucleoside-diphosphate-sugar epimerase